MSAKSIAYSLIGLMILGLVGCDYPGATRRTVFGASTQDPNTGATRYVVQLLGSVTDDGLPRTGQLTHEWSMVSGPGKVRFAKASDAQTEASFTAKGRYVLRLTANDGALESHDDVNVDIE